jgi:hypothetical protein
MGDEFGYGAGAEESRGERDGSSRRPPIHSLKRKGAGSLATKELQGNSLHETTLTST